MQKNQQQSLRSSIEKGIDYKGSNLRRLNQKSLRTSKNKNNQRDIQYYELKTEVLVKRTILNWVIIKELNRELCIRLSTL